MRKYATEEERRECRRQKDREGKRRRRAEDPKYAEMIRAKKREAYHQNPEIVKAANRRLTERLGQEEMRCRQRTADAKRRANGRPPEYREKERVATQKRRQNPKAITKEKARQAIYRAIRKGTLNRPHTCSQCGNVPAHGRDGRSLIRADHYMGYDPEHWLTVRWICCRCDGEQSRK